MVSTSSPSNRESGSVETSFEISGSKCGTAPLLDDVSAASMPAVRWKTSHASATCEMRAAKDSSGPERSRVAPPIPSGIRPFNAVLHLAAETQTDGERSGSRAVHRHLLNHLATAAGHQRGGLAGPVECRGAMAGPPKHEDHGGESRQIDLESVRPEIDVVAKEQRRLVAVDRTPDVGQDADVEKSGKFLRVQAQSSPQAHADPCRAQHVLGGLPETEVGGQGERDQ